MRKNFLALTMVWMLILTGLPFTPNSSYVTEVSAATVAPTMTPTVAERTAEADFAAAQAELDENGGSLFEDQEQTEGGYIISLNGAWEYIDAGVDETEKANMDQEPYDSEGNPTVNGPHDRMHLADYNKVKNGTWKAVPVPYDLHNYLPLRNAMRVWYKTTVKVENKDKMSFALDFTGTSWIATVIVDGKEVGGKKGTGMPWKLDISEEVRNSAGDTVEIVVGVKAPRYAIDPKGTAAMSGTKGSINEYWTKYTKLSDYVYDPQKAALNDSANPAIEWIRTGTTDDVVPLRHLKWLAPIYPSNKGNTSGDRFGITGSLDLVAHKGSVYVNDVFVKTTDVVNADYETGLGDGNIAADIELINGSNSDKTVTVKAVAVEKKEAQKAREENRAPEVARQLVSKTSETVTIKAKSSLTYQYDKTEWKGAKLWWPDLNAKKAHMYELRVEITEGSEISDIAGQFFGFRDVTIDGKYIRVNGLRRNFWNNLNALSAFDEKGDPDIDKALEKFIAEGNRFERYGEGLGLKKMLGGAEPQEQMDWLDDNGLPVRYQTMIDGMFASFRMYDTSAGKVNIPMFINFKEQVEDSIKNFRNHPSIMMYSLENELLYVNAALLYRSNIKDIEAACKEYMSKPAKLLDPNMPTMYDGGGAFVDNSSDIYCPHYQDDTDITINSKPLTDFPVPANQNLWTYDDKRPYVAGEVAYFSGTPPEHAWIGGAEAANGQAGASKAYDKFVRSMLSRFRWSDAAVVCPWFASAGAAQSQVVMHEISAIRETYSTTLYEASSKNLKVKVFNDTFKKTPVNFKWTLTVDGKVESSGEETLNIEPGFGEVVTMKAVTPAISGERANAVLKLETSQGETKWSEEQSMSVIKKISGLSLGKKVFVYAANQKKPEIPAKYKTAAQKKKYKKTAGYKKALAKFKELKATDSALIKQLKSWGLKPTELKESIKVQGYKIKKKTGLYKKANLKGKAKKKIAKGATGVLSAKKGKATQIEVNGKKWFVNSKVIKKTKVTQTMNASNYKKFIKNKNGILVVARDAIKSGTGKGDSAALVRFTRAGGRVVCLEQTKETKMFTSEADSKNELPFKLNCFYAERDYLKANYVFGQGFDRPMLQGLTQTDLSNWNFTAADVTDNTTSTTENLWAIPETGKTWASAGVKGGNGLEATALIEMPVISGVLIATQFKVNDRIKVEPAAQKLLSNMLLAADKYKLPTSSVGYLSSGSKILATALEQTNTVLAPVASVKDGLNIKKTPIFVVEATVENMTTLNDLKGEVNAYAEAGGWLMLWNLTPEGLDKYNSLMDTEHIIRPYRREMTRSVDDWTTIGVSTSDLTLFTDYFVAPWANKRDVSINTFSYCIDATDDVAPFHDFEKEGYGLQHKANRDSDRANLVGDLYDSDFWMYIYQTWHDSGQDLWTNTKDNDAKGLDVYTFSFTGLSETKRSYKINKVEVFNNDNYNTYKDFRVSVGNDQVSNDEASSKDAAKVYVELPDANEPRDFVFEGGKEGNSVKLRAITVRNKGASVPMFGIDDVKIIREQPQWLTDSGCKSLTSNGGLVKYTKGEGGIIMNNLKMTDLEEFDASGVNVEPKLNMKSKYKVFTVMLQNLGAKTK